MLLQTVLEGSARATPDKTALVCGAQRLSYATLDAQANALARALRERGVQRGDRVTLCLDNSVDAVVGLFAVWKAGAIAVPLNPSTKASKLQRLIAQCGARLLMVAQAKAPELASAVPCDVLTAPWPTNDGAVATGHDDGAAPCIDVDLACILFTSGTTGDPKGVMHSHQGLLSVTRSIVQYLQHRADDVVLSVLPLSFGYGLTQLLPTFMVGGTLVLEKGFAFPQATLQKMQQERVTGFAMVPTIAAMLLQNDLTRFDLSTLRTLTNAGAGIAPDVLLRVRQRLPHTRIFPMYGQTECIRALFLAPEQVDARPDSVGHAIPNSEVWIVDDDGGPVPDGQTGELVVRGAHVMRGYWDNPTASAHKLRPGPLPGERVLFTGDLFRKEADGLLYFVSRKDDVIKTRGEKVSPKEVEDVLYALPGVVEAAVIGVADPLLGAAVRAYVVLEAGAPHDEKALLRHCALHLEDFAIPKRVELLDALPKTANAKIDKMALRQRAEGMP